MCRQSIICSTTEPEHQVAQYTAIATKKIMDSALQRLTSALDDPSHSKLGRAVRDQIFLACNARAPVGQTSSVRHGSSVRKQCVCTHTRTDLSGDGRGSDESTTTSLCDHLLSCVFETEKGTLDADGEIGIPVVQIGCIDPYGSCIDIIVR